jgi:transposase-like protein
LETCIQFNIHSTGALVKWIALYDKEGAEGFVKQDRKSKPSMVKRIKKPKSEEEELLEELASLREENAYLKKLIVLTQAHKEKKSGNHPIIKAFPCIITFTIASGDGQKHISLSSQTNQKTG